MPSPGGLKGKLRQGVPGSPIKRRQSHIHSSSKALALWHCFPGTGLGDPKTGQAPPWDVHGHGLCPCTQSHIPSTCHSCSHPCACSQAPMYPTLAGTISCALAAHAMHPQPPCTYLDTSVHPQHSGHTPLPVHTHSMPRLYSLPLTLTLHTPLPTHTYPHCAHSPHTLHIHPMSQPHSIHIVHAHPHSHLAPHAHSPYPQCTLAAGCRVPPHSIHAHLHHSHFFHTPHTPCYTHLPLVMHPH